MATLTSKTGLPSKNSTPVDDVLFQLGVDQYHDMIDQGILTEDDPVELLEGVLVRKMPKKRAHSHSTQISRDALAKVLPTGWFVDVQEPITTEDSEPEPDLTVVRGERRQFRKRHPGPKDVGMLAEVADTTLQRDRGTKKRLYARAEIPVYWIINLPEQQVEVYTNPTGRKAKPDYRRRQDFGPDDEVPIILDGKEVGRVKASELLS